MPVSELRIARVEAIHLRVPFRRPLLDATGEYTHRRTWLLRIVDSEDREGLGEAAVSPTAADATEGSLATLMRGVVAALAAGSTPTEAEMLAEGEPGRATLAAVSGALAMLAALRREAAGETAGARDGTGSAEIPVSATIAFGGADAGAEAAVQAVELGFMTLELRAGFERRTDQLVDRVRAIRAAVGPEPRLRIDAGGAWDLETATERLLALEPFRVEHVEQPLAAWDLSGHAALRERVRVPVALDESVDSEGSARAALAERAADVLVVKPVRVGGEAATLRIAQLARERGASVVLASYFETGVGIATALRIAERLRDAGARGGVDGRAHGLASAGVLGHDLLGAPLVIDDGRMPVPVDIALDERELARLALERVEAAAG